jgi:hypothetical protein
VICAGVVPFAKASFSSLCFVSRIIKMLCRIWRKRTYPLLSARAYISVFPTRQFSSQNATKTNNPRTLHIAKQRLLAQIQSLSHQREQELKKLLDLHSNAIFKQQGYDFEDAKNIFNTIFQHKDIEGAKEFVKNMKSIEDYRNLDEIKKRSFFGQTAELDAQMKNLISLTKIEKLQRDTINMNLRSVKDESAVMTSATERSKRILQAAQETLALILDSEESARKKIEQKMNTLDFNFVIGGDSRYAKAVFVNRLLRKNIFPVKSANLPQWSVIVEIEFKEGIQDVEWIGIKRKSSNAAGSDTISVNFIDQEDRLVTIDSDKIGEQMASDDFERIRCYVDSPVLKGGLKIVMLNVHKDEAREEETQWLIDEIQKSCLQIFLLHFDQTGSSVGK